MYAIPLIEKQSKLAVIGLGYVGLPIALAFAKKINVIGFDINEARIDKMKQGIDPSGELQSAEFDNSTIEFTADKEVLRQAQVFIVTVPTPIDEHNSPDLGPLLSATKTIAQVLKKGDVIVYESTVYPGCTEEDCIPLLERVSGLEYGTDFQVGYSPERINPGDKEHTITKILKVVAANDKPTTKAIADVYSIIVEAGVYQASSIKVAEAAKIIENTQRDVNIALMNELSQICHKLNINTYEVLEAAGTKWNFLKFQPGLVGGHCIGVDPYYLTYKAKNLGLHPQVILSGRNINDSMGSYIAQQTIKKLVQNGRSLGNGRVLIMGVTFKENVEDIRNSKVVDVMREFESYGFKVDAIDPHADPDEFFYEYNMRLTKDAIPKYDAVVLAVPHKEYIGMDEACFKGLLHEGGILVDIKGLYRKVNVKVNYWSL
ncbi:MAG: nucleotide sugar dehydrogenase [Cytophagaceae bacterium]